MAGFVVYDKIDGKILRTGFCSDADVELQPDREGEAVIRHETICSYEYDYVSGGTVQPRPMMALDVSRTSVAENEIASISNIPHGCEVKFYGESHKISDGVLEWSSSAAGIYDLVFCLFPFREEVVTIEVLK